MKQILAIFVKDARHLWLEILVSLATATALVLVYPNHWLATESIHGQMLGSLAFSEGTLSFLASCLIVLLPVSWWILMARRETRRQHPVRVALAVESLCFAFFVSTPQFS